MKPAKLLIAFSILSTAACHSVTDTAKQAINKTGEVIGAGSSELAKGISNGVTNTFNSEIVIADDLKHKGVSYGKFNITSDSASSSKNKLVIYLIFDKDFVGPLSVKVFDQQGSEYGRATATVTAKQGAAQYLDFVFDTRTDIESKSKFVIE